MITIGSAMVAWGYKNSDGSVKENVIRDLIFGWLKKTSQLIWLLLQEKQDIERIVHFVLIRRL